MNEKLRSILHTAWNEPRHFFFWLAMLSVCGFAGGRSRGAALVRPGVCCSRSSRWAASCVSW